MVGVRWHLPYLQGFALLSTWEEEESMKKSFKRALTLVLAGAMIFGVTDYSTISAAKTKKKSTKTSAKVTLKLSKTKATLNEGKKLTLKIKKKNVKKIKSQKWSTSK